MPFLTEMNRKNKKFNLFRLTATSILSAAALGISFAEKMLMSALPLPMGIKPGFSNILVMFTCKTLGIIPALGIALVKAAFSALMSGAVSGIISFTGGLFSIAAMYILQKSLPDKLSYTGISVISSVMHNMGQLTAASVIAGSSLFMSYTPVLLVSGTAFGIVTGIIFNHTMPYLTKLRIFDFRKFNKYKENTEE